ncbi:aldolase catalytic domain-containing protein [Psychrobacter celer]|uniref:aldolase catalytic domain-containing protein n=1 Tax=Psychrobacter celer TaxID=306572 RepID=UPI003FD2CAE1
MFLLDCTLRDGGYYNSWDFSREVIDEYLEAMAAAGVNVVELGLRSLKNSGFKGATAFTTDDFIKSLPIPDGLTVGVMINAAELVGDKPQLEVLEALFPVAAAESPVDLVRIASHVYEFEEALQAVSWLKDKGYQVGFNLMQIADRTEDEVVQLAKLAKEHPLDALYFADSMGSMMPEDVSKIVGWLRTHWQGALGIHTHDNLNLALSNTLRAISEGVTWVDATVTGMGRGPGNARTEELAIEVAELRDKPINLVPLMTIIRKYFKPMQIKYGWGTNPYYFLAGKYGIHPSYIQSMMADARYDEEDLLAVIDYLRDEGGKKFSNATLNNAREFYSSKPQGTWSPSEAFAGREVLLLGSGPGVWQHRDTLERYIKENKPLVVAMNTQTDIDARLIDYRIACQPVRLLADVETHAALPQPLITPYTMLPNALKSQLAKKEIKDFGICVKSDMFAFGDNYCTVPSSLVACYALATITSGKATKIWLAGFDGYGADDPRAIEMKKVLRLYKESSDLPITAITPTTYNLSTQSIYAM